MKDACQNHARSQVAVEYIVLLGVVTAIVLVGFSSFLRETRGVANSVINQAFTGLMGGNTVLRSRITVSADGYP